MVKINHTQIANEFLDEYLNKVSGSATKVFLAICRKTIGWQKDIDVISQSQIIKMTGLSINNIKRAIDELIGFDLIKVERTGNGKAIKTFYELNYNVSKNNISNFDTKEQSNISNFDRKSQNNISNFDTTKESNINKEYKETISNEIDAQVTKKQNKNVNKFNAKNVIDIFHKAYLEHHKTKPVINPKESNQAKNFANICIQRSPDNPIRFCEELVRIAFEDTWFQTHSSIATLISQINAFIPRLPQPEFKSAEKVKAEQEEERKLRELTQYYVKIGNFKYFHEIYDKEGREGALKLYERIFGDERTNTN